MRQNFFLIVSVAFFIFWPGGVPDTARGQEQEFVIVKYGSLSIKSSVSAKVFIDETYKGTTDNILESIVAGEHVISCRTEDKEVTGTFQIKKNETLRLEARFDEAKLILYKEREVVKEEIEKKAPEPLKPEKKKPAATETKKTVVEMKKTEQKNPVEERRKNHLNVMRIEFDTADEKVQIEHKGAPAISKYTEKKDQIGKYYRTKQGVLLCDAGPCETSWTTSFVYTDETGKADALLYSWKETIFNGITPSGTSKRELECCLNGQCSKMLDTAAADTPQEFDVGRYRLIWSKGLLVTKRSDIMKEILDAGGSLNDYR